MNHKKKILVIRFSSIGDVVLTNIIYKILKDLYPESHISALVKEEYADVIRYNPYINEIISFNSKTENTKTLLKSLKEKHFDIIIDLHNNLRSNMIKRINKKQTEQILTYKKENLKRRLLLYLKWNLLKSKTRVIEKYIKTITNQNFELKNFIIIPDFITDKIKSLLKQSGFSCGEYYAVSPDAAWETKKWDKYNELIEALIRSGRKVVLLGKNKIDYRAEPQSFLNLSGRLSLLESSAVIKFSRQFIGNDTGLTHIADALQIPLITIWGPTVQEFGFAPLNPEARVVEIKDLSCRPCSLHGSAKCPKSHFNCMKKITIDMVLKYVK